jgi:hypothetical protein
LEKITVTDSKRLAKNISIKKAIKDTHEKRLSQVCRVFTCKIQENKLSKLQKEELAMMFIEAKWIWNDIIRSSDSKIVGENNVISPWDYKLKNTVYILVLVFLVVVFYS